MILICTEVLGSSFTVDHLYEIQGNDGLDLGYLHDLSNNDFLGVIHLPTLEYWLSSEPSDLQEHLLARFEPACEAMNILYGVE